MPASSSDRDISDTWLVRVPRFCRKIYGKLGFQQGPPTVPAVNKHDISTPESQPTLALAPLPAQQLIGHQAQDVDEVQGRTMIQHPERGILSDVKRATIHDSTMVDMSTNYYDSERPMKSFAKHTMRGAEFDSSARSPPPRCHPGTRLTIMERAQRWLYDAEREKKIIWLVGPAGAGKSAIMQTLAESVPESNKLMLAATLFFSRPNGRNKPSQVFVTIAYQIAIKNAAYREFLLKEMAVDPWLHEKSMGTQFTKLIVKPFARQRIYLGPGSPLILIDGLDECEGAHAQREIIDLVSSFALTYPGVPLIWVIASRPEFHLQMAFAHPSVASSYEREDVPTDSDEACADVEKYLQKEFESIRQGCPVGRLRSRWPTESQFIKVAAAASGLFAYASTAIGFVGDSAYANPLSRLDQLLAVIEKSSSSKRIGSHPLADLNELYTFILSQIPAEILPVTILLLTNHLILMRGPTSIRSRDNGLVFLCNWYGMSLNDAYGALHQLHSVLNIPSAEDAETSGLAFHHQSFYEYLIDSERSLAFHISPADIEKQELDCCLRILKEAHSGVVAKRGVTVPVTNIVLAWTTESGDMQKALYDQAAWSVIGILYRFHPNRVVSVLRDSTFIAISGTINLMDPWISNGASVKEIAQFFYRIHRQLDPRVLAELRKLKLLREIPIGTLDLSNLVEERNMCIRCESMVSDKDELGLRKGLDMSGPEPIDYESNYKYWWYNRRTDAPPGKLLQLVIDDLEHVKTRSPDLPVLLFGNVACAYLIYEFKTPDKSTTPDPSLLWTYFVPYRYP